MLKYFIGTLLTALSLTLVSAQPDLPRLETTRCAFNRPFDYSVECALVVVPENRENADSTRTLELAVAVLRSRNPNALRDPIIYLDGGPGGHTLASLEFFAAEFEPFLQTRDVIFFDQRGVGLSQALDCPAYTDFSYDVLDQDIPLKTIIQQVNAVLLACRDQYVNDGVDLTAYTTAANAADVRDIIHTLGYEQANLLGISYGSRLALTIMRDYPASVRSAIIDAVLPLQVNPDSEFLTNTHQAFSTLFTSCANDKACNQQYPDLETVFYDTVERLNANPETISAFDFYTGEQRTILVNGEVLTFGLFSLLYQSGEIPSLPQYIFDAAVGDYDAFVNDLLFTNFQSAYFDEVLFTTIGCNEEMPFDTLTAADDTGIPAVLAQPLITLLAGDFELCAAWGTAQPDPRENVPVRSDIPTLITVGVYDPITPPHWAELTAETLSNSHLYVFPAVGHAAFASSTCATNLMLAFVNDPEQAPDATCIDNLPPPLFATGIITEVNRQPYTDPNFGFSSVLPDDWYEIEPGVFSPFPDRDPTPTPVIAFRFPTTIDDYVSRIIINGFYDYERLPDPIDRIRANGRTWRIYHIERPDQNVYAIFAFYEEELTPYVIGVTATTPEERDFLQDAVFIPAIEAFEPADFLID